MKKRKIVMAIMGNKFLLKKFHHRCFRISCYVSAEEIIFFLVHSVIGS